MSQELKLNIFFVLMRKSRPCTVKARRTQCYGYTPAAECRPLPCPCNSHSHAQLPFPALSSTWKPLAPHMLWCQDGVGQMWLAEAPPSLSYLPFPAQYPGQQWPSSRWIVYQRFILLFLSCPFYPSNMLQYPADRCNRLNNPPPFKQRGSFPNPWHLWLYYLPW